MGSEVSQKYETLKIMDTAGKPGINNDSIPLTGKIQF
jgi:hypothetical protein